MQNQWNKLVCLTYTHRMPHYIIYYKEATAELKILNHLVLLLIQNPTIIHQIIKFLKKQFYYNLIDLALKYLTVVNQSTIIIVYSHKYGCFCQSL